MKKIKKFKTNQEVIEFFRNLKGEFTLTDFDTILSLMKGITPYSYEVKLKLSTEASYERKSSQRISIINFLEDSGENFTQLKYDWITSSNHTVNIEGDSNEGFTLSIGEDESEFFYDTVVELSEKRNRFEEDDYMFSQQLYLDIEKCFRTVLKYRNSSIPQFMEESEEEKQIVYKAVADTVFYLSNLDAFVKTEVVKKIVEISIEFNEDLGYQWETVPTFEICQILEDLKIIKGMKSLKN